MILYLDTSSLVKLYVEEPGSHDVQRLVDRAEIVGTSAVAYAEAAAALARRKREKSLTIEEHRLARTGLDADWPRLLVLDATEPLARKAGGLAERYALRGFDAIHLGSYLLLRDEFPQETVSFSSADRILNRAARRAARGRRTRPAKQR